MGLVIKIWVSDRWEQTYFVQDLNEEEAKKKAYKMFKHDMSCFLPDTLEEAEKCALGNERNIDFYIEIIATVDQIII